MNKHFRYGMVVILALGISLGSNSLSFASEITYDTVIEYDDESLYSLFDENLEEDNADITVDEKEISNQTYVAYNKEESICEEKAEKTLDYELKPEVKKRS